MHGMRIHVLQDKWEELEPMKVARTGLGVGALKGDIHATACTSYLSAVEEHLRSEGAQERNLWS
jgi:hypothetical protein